MNLLERFTARTHPLADANEFARFYEDTHLKTYRYLMALTGADESRSEDITAEAYLRAWKNRQNFTGNSDAAIGWVLTIARRILIDEYRSETTQPAQAELTDAVLDDAPLTETVLMTQEIEGQVIAALQKLPENQREMVVLRYVLGWRVNQLAERMGVPENTISVTLHRALQRLQGLLTIQGAVNERAQ